MRAAQFLGELVVQRRASVVRVQSHREPPEVPQVQRAALVQEVAQVQEAALVQEVAQVQEAAQVQGVALVQGAAPVQGAAQVQVVALVQGAAQVQGVAPVQGAAQVQGVARVQEAAQVQGVALVQEAAQVQGAALVQEAAPVQEVDRARPARVHSLLFQASRAAKPQVRVRVAWSVAEVHPAEAQLQEAEVVERSPQVARVGAVQQRRAAVHRLRLARVLNQGHPLHLVPIQILELHPG